MATPAMVVTSGTRVHVVAVGRVSGRRFRTRAAARASDKDGREVDYAAPVSSGASSRRAVLFAAGAATALTPLESLAADFGSVSLASDAVNEPLKPLAEYTAALERAASELDDIAKVLSEESGVSTPLKGEGATLTNDAADPNSFDDPELSVAAPLSQKTRTALKTKLHSGSLGRFWVTARGADRYLAGALSRSSFARDKEDLWKLIPEKSGPLGKLLVPNFDNPDDPLCLIYSCVNDPRAPPSIDTLYALKLLDEGFATKGVTARGLSGNCRDAAEKLRAYQNVVRDKADGALVDKEWRNPAPAKGWGRVGI
jgi:hypothetical protein